MRELLSTRWRPKFNVRRAFSVAVDLLIVLLLVVAIFWPLGRQVIAGINICAAADEPGTCVGRIWPWVVGLVLVCGLIVGVTLRVFYPDVAWPVVHQGVAALSGAFLLLILIYAIVVLMP